ncbi:hypothetical protein [Defluviimonas sp. WL0075]|uniref:Uncharacterized protein n=1 Tax=Albidovulum sediminicola TaxID=2984331 RepID=A0ABT2YZK1_9RHOB|nr:hypothetical protein [Defluviimonas sp. WL0075]MCV2864315.1 hypothetical protein [Defluviimonas sp. WL0075]
MDRHAVLTIVQSYLRGASGEGADLLDHALHPEFRAAGWYDGRETWPSRQDVLALAAPLEAPSEGAGPD